MSGQKLTQLSKPSQSWMEKCKVLFLPTRAHPLVHKYRQLEADKVLGARKRNFLATRLVHFRTKWSPGYVCLNPAESYQLQTPRILKFEFK